MITIPEQTILQTMQSVIDNILIPKFIELGMNASGEWISSLEPRVNGQSGEIWGRDYTYYLVNGRAGGNRPPIAPLVRWVGYKLGLSGAEATGAAFAIANKIAKEGTDYYPDGTDLLEVLSSKETTQYIYNEIGAELSGQLRTEIVRMAKQNLQYA